MKLIINKPFEVDVELSDFIPKYLCIKFNLVCDQSVELENNEMNDLISLFNFSSTEFNKIDIVNIDEKTLSWG